MRTALGWAAGLIALIALLATAFLLVFDWNMLRNVLAERLSEELGREFAVDGNLEGSLGLQPRIKARDVRVANAGWAAEPNMVEIESLQMQLDLRSLARGRFVVSGLQIRGAAVHLEIDAEGRSSWDLGREPDEPPWIPLIESLVIEESRLTYHDRRHEVELDAIIASAEGTSPKRGAGPVTIAGEGRFQHEEFTLAMRGASLRDLRARDEPYPVEVEVRVGATEATLNGSVAKPFRLTDMKMALSVKGPNAYLLAPVLQLPLPSTRPYELAGDLEREADVWRFENFSGVVGDSDLAGSLSLDVGQKRPLIIADLVSEHLEFVDLGPLIGLHPGDGVPAEPDEERPRRLLPDAPLQREQIQKVDARVTFRGQLVVAPQLPLRDVELSLDLEDGVMKLAPLRFGFAGGTLDLFASIYATVDPAHSDVDLRLSAIQLQDIFDELGLEAAADGVLQGRALFSTRGDTVRSAMGTAAGEAAVVMERGRIDGTVLTLLDAGFLEALALRGENGEPQPMVIRCFVAGLEIEDGIMTASTMVLDTERTLIAGEGAVDLGEETLTLRIEGQPKDPGIAHSRVPVEVSGQLTSLSLEIDPSGVMVRGGLALGLGVLIGPLAAIVPFIGLGLAEDSDCLHLIEEAQQLLH
jgi:AsmA family protein